MSKQHVFPDRLRHILPRKGGERLKGSWHQISKDGKAVRETRTHKVSQGSTGSHRIRKVCLPCNNGWLAAMETECIPLVEELIQGAAPPLNPRQQENIAKVAMSICMVGEWIQPDAVSTTQAERAYFMKKLAPPPGWFVFLGRDGTRLDEPRFLSSGSAPQSKPGINGPKLYTSFVITMGQLLLNVITVDPDIFLDPDGYARILGLAPICPSTEGLHVGLLPILSPAHIGNIRALTMTTMRKIAQRK